MSWIITYAVSSTLLMSLAIAFERRLRVEWRETVLWLAVTVPLLAATISVFIPEHSVAPATLVPAITVTLPAAPATQEVSLRDTTSTAIAIWFVVAALLFFRDVYRRHRLLSILDRTVVAGRTLQRLSTRIGLRRNIVLTESASLPVPVAIGRSEVCVPSRLLRAEPSDDLEPILLHELAHLRRHDPYAQQALKLISILLWWQPLNRTIASRLSAVAELRTDALASIFVPATRLASALVTFAQRPRIAQVAGLPAFPSGLLSERIAMLLADTRPHVSFRTRAIASVGIAAIALILTPRFQFVQSQIAVVLDPLRVSPVIATAKPELRELAMPSSRPGVSRKTTPQTVRAEQEPTDAEIVGALQALLRDPAQHVRAAARASLTSMNTPESQSALRADPFGNVDATKDGR